MNSPCFGCFDACLVASLSRGKAMSAALTSDHAVAVVERDKETVEFEGPGGRAAVITVDVTVIPSEDEEFSVSVDTDNTDDHHPAADVDNRGSEVADGQPLLSDSRKKYDNLLNTIRIGTRRGVINQVLFTIDGQHLSELVTLQISDLLVPYSQSILGNAV